MKPFGQKVASLGAVGLVVCYLQGHARVRHSTSTAYILSDGRLHWLLTALPREFTKQQKNVSSSLRNTASHPSLHGASWDATGCVHANCKSNCGAPQCQHCDCRLCTFCDASLIIMDHDKDSYSTADGNRGRFGFPLGLSTDWRLLRERSLIHEGRSRINPYGTTAETRTSSRGVVSNNNNTDGSIGSNGMDARAFGQKDNRIMRDDVIKKNHLFENNGLSTAAVEAAAAALGPVPSSSLALPEAVSVKASSDTQLRYQSLHDHGKPSTDLAIGVLTRTRMSIRYASISSTWLPLYSQVMIFESHVDVSRVQKIWKYVPQRLHRRFPSALWYLILDDDVFINQRLLDQFIAARNPHEIALYGPGFCDWGVTGSLKQRIARMLDLALPQLINIVIGGIMLFTRAAVLRFSDAMLLMTCIDDLETLYSNRILMWDGLKENAMYNQDWLFCWCLQVRMNGTVYLDNAFEDTVFPHRKCLSLTDVARQTVGVHHASPRHMRALWRAYRHDVLIKHRKRSREGRLGATLLQNTSGAKTRHGTRHSFGKSGAVDHADMWPLGKDVSNSNTRGSSNAVVTTYAGIPLSTAVGSTEALRGSAGALPMRIPRSVAGGTISAKLLPDPSRPQKCMVTARGSPYHHLAWQDRRKLNTLPRPVRYSA